MTKLLICRDVDIAAVRSETPSLLLRFILRTKLLLFRAFVRNEAFKAVERLFNQLPRKAGSNKREQEVQHNFSIATPFQQMILPADQNRLDNGMVDVEPVTDRSNVAEGFEREEYFLRMRSVPRMNTWRFSLLEK